MKASNLLTSAMLALLTAGLAGCGPDADSEKSKSGASPSEQSYVAPGEKDEFYLFYSGGHSGQVFVAGMPSMRHIFTIPVFT
ncbi:MAG: nitrous-oxide reductase, partial [Opitutales bacterium]